MELNNCDDFTKDPQKSTKSIKKTGRAIPKLRLQNVNLDLNNKYELKDLTLEIES